MATVRLVKAGTGGSAVVGGGYLIGGIAGARLLGRTVVRVQITPSHSLIGRSWLMRTSLYSPVFFLFLISVMCFWIRCFDTSFIISFCELEEKAEAIFAS